MQRRDLDEEFRLEGLRHMQSMHRARERSHTLGLVERAVILAVTAAGAILALIHSLG